MLGWGRKLGWKSGHPYQRLFLGHDRSRYFSLGAGFCCGTEQGFTESIKQRLLSEQDSRLRGNDEL